MALGTYAELKTAIAEWLAEDSLLTARVGDLIAFCEATLNANPEFRLLQMQSAKTADLISGDVDITLPTDYLEMQYVTVTTEADYPNLTYVSPDVLVSTTEDPGYQEVYSIIGGKIRLAHDPGSDQELEMGYYARIPALSDTNTTNWLLTLDPRAYLYGSLIHAEPYLENDARIATWKILYNEAVQGLIDANENAETTGGTLIVGLPEAVAG